MRLHICILQIYLEYRIQQQSLHFIYMYKCTKYLQTCSLIFSIFIFTESNLMDALNQTCRGSKIRQGRRGHDHIVVGFTTTYVINTNVVSSNLTHGEVYSIQHYVIKFVSDSRQVSGFLRFLLSIKLTATI